VVPDEAEACIFARTVAGSTFVEDVGRLRPTAGEVEILFERRPELFHRLEGLPMAPVPFGSDAHTLRRLVRDGFVALAGPGSIRVAHTEDEHLDLAEAEAGVRLYQELADRIRHRTPGPEYAI